MPLPTIATPTYELILPSTGKKIKYRPFLVKEEKVLKKCIMTRGIKVDSLPTFDIEYIFLNIRAKSIGESIKVVVKCPDDGVTEVPVTIYVDEIEVSKPEGHTTDIVLDKTMTLRMKYPSLSQFIESNFDVSMTPEETVEKTFKVIADCMDTVFTAEDAWEAKDYTAKERLTFIEQLNSKQYKDVERFFSTMPKLSHSVEVENPNTGVKNTVVLEGLADFFA
jgi:hypothetical protein